MKKLIKVLKWTGIVVGSLFALLLVALLAHPLWLGATVKGVANSVVPGIVGVRFELGGADINLYKGHVEIGDLKLWNPTNYSTEFAAKLDRFSVDVDMGSLLSEKIVVKDVLVKDVYASYVTEDDRNNFDVILENATGPKKDEEVKEEKPAEEKGAGKKVEIDRLTIDGVSVKIGYVTVPVPVAISLTDIGKESDGVTWAEAWNEILNAVLKAIGSVGDGVKALGSIGVDAVMGLSDGLKSIGGDAGKAAGKIGDGAKKAFNVMTGVLK